MVTTRHTAVSPYAAAWHSACPRCGRGRLFSSFLQVAERCDMCGLDLAKNDSGDGPAVFLIFILGFLAVPLAFWIWTAFDLPTWAPALIASAFVIVLAALLLRPSKALVVALQYRHRREELEGGS